MLQFRDRSSKIYSYGFSSGSCLILYKNYCSELVWVHQCHILEIRTHFGKNKWLIPVFGPSSVRRSVHNATWHSCSEKEIISVLIISVQLSNAQTSLGT